MYDPKDPEYIHTEMRKVKPLWNERMLSFFGYNGNYPEVLRNALVLRGNWKILHYNEMCAIQVKCGLQKASPYSKKRQSVTASFDSGHTASLKPDLIQVDELIIDRCNFIWRPVNYYEQV